VSESYSEARKVSCYLIYDSGEFSRNVFSIAWRYCIGRLSSQCTM